MPRAISILMRGALGSYQQGHQLNALDAGLREPVALVFMDDAHLEEGVPCNFKGVIPACQVSPLVKYTEYCAARGLFVHKRLAELGASPGFLILGLFGNPTNWFGADGTGCPSLASCIPDLRELLDRHKRLQILVDYSWEGALGDEFFPGFDTFVRDLGVAPNRVVVLVSNEGIEDRYARYLRESRRSPADWYRVIGDDLWLMYSAVELRQKHWYAHPESLVRESEVDDARHRIRQRKFLSFNRRPRWHRFLLALMIGRLGLESDGFVSMSSSRYQGDWASEDERVAGFGASMDPSVWSELSGVKDRVYATLPWNLDINMEQNSGQPELYLFATQSRDLFLQSYTQIITESYMEGDCADVFITEKTCRAIANLQPFLVFGHAGTLRRFRKHGFEPVPFFDGGYDEALNLGHRLTKLYQCLADLQASSIRDLHERYYAVFDILRFNRERLFQMPTILAASVATRLRRELWVR